MYRRLKLLIARSLARRIEMRRNDMLAKIDEVIVEAFRKDVAVEHLDAHRSLVKIGPGWLANILQKIGGYPQRIEDLRVFGLFNELNDPAFLIRVHDSKPSRRLPIHRNGADGQVRIRFDMLTQNLTIIHSVELVAAENDIVIERALEEVAKILPDGVRGALVPMRPRRRLLRREDLDETGREVVELECGVDMPMQ